MSPGTAGGGCVHCGILCDALAGMEQRPVDTPRVASVAEVASVAVLLDAFNREYDITTPGKAVLSHCSTLPRAALSWSTILPSTSNSTSRIGLEVDTSTGGCRRGSSPGLHCGRQALWGRYVLRHAADTLAP